MSRSLLIPMLSPSLVLTACGGKQDGKSAKEDEPGRDWSAKPLKAVDAAFGQVKFSVELPEGFKLDNQGGVPNSESTRAWLGRICDSLKLK